MKSQPETFISEDDYNISVGVPETYPDKKT